MKMKSKNELLIIFDGWVADTEQVTKLQEAVKMLKEVFNEPNIELTISKDNFIEHGFDLKLTMTIQEEK